MSPAHYDDGRTVVHLGDCLEVMAAMPADSVDAIVTDPPYGLGFMGKHWDALPPGLDWARECLRVLKPGGHLVAFGGTRTWHRLAVAVEDAGFEVRDSIAWLYGGRFVTGDRLKPSHEPAVLARKRGAGPGLSLDRVRVGTERRVNGPAANKPGGAVYDLGITGMSPDAKPREAVGRWPANAILDESAAAELEAQKPGASRFFYCAKAPTSERPKVGSLTHPTVKPLALMRYLIRLVTPEGGVVLDPFAGSGTTVEAAIVEGFEVIGIEREVDYWPLIRQRIARGEGVNDDKRF